MDRSEDQEEAASQSTSSKTKARTKLGPRSGAQYNSPTDSLLVLRQCTAYRLARSRCPTTLTINLFPNRFDSLTIDLPDRSTSTLRRTHYPVIGVPSPGRPTTHHGAMSDPVLDPLLHFQYHLPFHRSHDCTTTLTARLSPAIDADIFPSVVPLYRSRIRVLQ